MHILSEDASHEPSIPHLSIVDMHVSCGCTHAHARRQWTALRFPWSSITMRGVHGQRSEINRNASDWHGWSWLTRVTLTVGSSCCPPSPPPPCLTQLMAKLGSVQRCQCQAGENTMLSFFFFFWEKTLILFSPAILCPSQNGHNSHRRHKLYYYIKWYYHDQYLYWSLAKGAIAAILPERPDSRPFNQLAPLVPYVWKIQKP